MHLHTCTQECLHAHTQFVIVITNWHCHWSKSTSLESLHLLTYNILSNRARDTQTQKEREREWQTDSQRWRERQAGRQTGRQEGGREGEREGQRQRLINCTHTGGNHPLGSQWHSTTHYSNQLSSTSLRGHSLMTTSPRGLDQCLHPVAKSWMVRATHALSCLADHSRAKEHGRNLNVKLFIYC